MIISPRKYLLHFLLYLLLFSLLFLQFPLSGSLPGKGDNWFFLAAYRNIANYFSGLLNGTYLGTVIYPEHNVYEFGNYSPGQALFFLPFIYVGFDDLFAYYCFNVILFTLNAFTVYLISGKFGIQSRASFFCGLFFAGSNFAFGNLDNPDALFLSFGFLSVFFLLRFLKNFRNKNLLWSFSSLGVQVYFSSYGFLFSALMLGIIGLFNLRELVIPSRLKVLFLGGIILLAIISPFLNVYFFAPSILSAYNPAGLISDAGKASLKIVDFFHPLQNNMYYSIMPHNDSNWLYKTKSAFTGFALPLAGLFGLLKFKSLHKKYLISAFLLFLFVAFGPFFPLENKEIPSPLYWIYYKFSINQYLRISVRAYFFCVLVLSLGAAKFIEWIYFSYSKKAAIILPLFILIENTPYSFEKYESKPLMDLAFRIPDFENHSVILNLPSSLYSDHYPLFQRECRERKDYEFEAVREHIYMYEQTLHRANTINGLTGFIPQSRIKNQLLIDRVTNGDMTGLNQLIRNNGLTHVIWQKKLTNGCNYTIALDLLNKSPNLKMVTDNEDITVYKVDS